MRSTTHSLPAQTRTSKQLALPSITCKPIRICKSQVVEHDTARTKKVAEKPVTMFIEAKAVEAIPLVIAAPSCSPDLPTPPQPSKPEVSELTQVMALVAELTALAGRLYPLTVLPATSSDSAPTKPKRKYAPRKTDQKVEAVPLIDRKWITFKQAAALYPKSEQAFRHLAHKSYQYLKHPKAGLRSNGFEACVVRQPGSRNVYLNAEELERWMAQGQGDAQ